MSSGSESNSPKNSQTRSRGVKSSPKSSKKSTPTPDKHNKNGNSSSKKNMPHLSAEEEKQEIARMVFWYRPVQTIYYFFLELVEIIANFVLKVLAYRKLVVLSLILAGLIVVGFNTDGSHLATLLYIRKKFFWYAYWVGLGVASSIGLGTGLHTFLLYLGPFIAEVTLAAYECKSLDFPEPPYPDEIMCPTGNAANSIVITIWSIMSKVRLESIMWGAGTAIGELPPYFMARASALSAMENHQSSSDVDEELEEFENLLKIEQDGSRELTWWENMRLLVFKIIKKVGFLGILLCASIPNPLFDLAGITCGHFLVKFWTFFGATLIGKAIIKMHIQQIFVIFLFSEHHLKSLFDLMGKLPVVGASLQPVFQEWLTAEKSKLHKKALNESSQHIPSESLLSWLLGKIVLLMVLFFVASIVNSLAQQRYKRVLNSAKGANDTPKKKVASD